MVRAVQTTLRGLGAAVRARPGTVLALVVAVFAVHVLLPPLILALARKPWTYFAFNPWLSQLPDYLASSAPLRQKLDFLSRLAVFWFSLRVPGMGLRRRHHGSGALPGHVAPDRRVRRAPALPARARRSRGRARRSQPRGRRRGRGGRRARPLDGTVQRGRLRRPRSAGRRSRVRRPVERDARPAIGHLAGLERRRHGRAHRRGGVAGAARRLDRRSPAGVTVRARARHRAPRAGTPRAGPLDLRSSGLPGRLREEGAAQRAQLAAAARQLRFRTTDFTSVYSAIPSWPPSRPRPDSLKPPDGISWV